MPIILKWLAVFLMVIFSLSGVNANNTIKSVPVAPNESLVTAKVLEIKLVDPESLNIEPKSMTLYSLKLLIKEVKDVPNKINRLKNKTGQVIIVYYKPKRGPCDTKKEPFYQLRAGATAQFKIKFCGDERHRSYWITDFVKIVNG